MSTSPSAPAWAPLTAVAVTLLSWASAFVAIRWVGREVDPAPLALGRLLIGSAVLAGFLLVRRRWVSPTRREWLLLVVCGLSWFAVYNVSLNAAELRLDAGTAAMVVQVGPILIAVLAGLFLGEGFGRWLLVGGAVALVGAVLIGTATARTDDLDVVGVLLAGAAAVTYAIGVLCQKPTLRRLPALQVTWIACTVGALACLPALPGLADDLGAASTGAVTGLVFLGVVPTALAFVTWAYALARMGAGQLSVTTYLVPPVTIVIAWVAPGEVPPVLAVVGGAVALVGVGLSRRRDRGRPPSVVEQSPVRP